MTSKRVSDEWLEDATRSVVAMIDGWYGGWTGQHIPAAIVARRLKRFLPIASPPEPVVTEAYDNYDAGLLNDFGGGNVEWWQDYLRAEIGRANDFWREQVVAAASPEPVEVTEEYSDTDELRDLKQSILQSNTLADFNAVKKTVLSIAALKRKGE